jgi:hypothetical protein
MFCRAQGRQPVTYRTSCQADEASVRSVPTSAEASSALRCCASTAVPSRHNRRSGLRAAPMSNSPMLAPPYPSVLLPGAPSAQCVGHHMPACLDGHGDMSMSRCCELGASEEQATMCSFWTLCLSQHMRHRLHLRASPWIGKHAVDLQNHVPVADK